MNYDSRIETAAQDSAEYSGNPFEHPSEDERRSKRRLIVIGIVVAALLAATWFWLHRSSGAEAAGDKKDQAPVVTVVTPGRTTVEGAISATGTLAARRELPVGSVGEGGQVVSVLVEPGQWVGAGQVLAVVDRSVQVQQQGSSAASIQRPAASKRSAAFSTEPRLW